MIGYNLYICMCVCMEMDFFSHWLVLYKYAMYLRKNMPVTPVIRLKHEKSVIHYAAWRLLVRRNLDLHQYNS